MSEHGGGVFTPENEALGLLKTMALFAVIGYIILKLLHIV